MNNHSIFLALAALVNGASFSMILPILAPLIRQLTLSEFQGGVMVSAGALFMALASLWIAKQQERYSPKRLMSLGFLGMSVTWAIFTFILYLAIHAILPSLLMFILLLLSRASTGVFMALPQIGLQSYVMTHNHNNQQRSQQMAMFGAMNSLGMIIGPFLTAILLFAGLLLPLWIAVVLLGLMGILLSFVLKQNSPTSHSNLNIPMAVVQQQSDPTIFKRSFIWLLLGFVTYIAIVTLNMTAGFYIQDQFLLNSQQSALYFSQCMLIVGLCLVLTQLLIVKVFQFGLNTLVAIGLSMMCCGLLLSIYASSIVIFQISYIFYGIAVACLLPAFTTGSAQAVAQSAQVKVASLCTTVQATGLIIGPLLSTSLYQFNIHSPFYLLLISILSLAIYFTYDVLKQGRLLKH